MQTEAKFFNGVSSKPIDVTLHLLISEKKLLIIVPDKEELYIPFVEINITHRDREMMMLSIGQPSCTLEIRNPNFSKIFLAEQVNNGTIWYHKLLNTGWKAYLLFASIVVTIIAAVYFLGIPFIAENALTILPRSIDKAIGEKVFEQVSESETIDTISSKLLTNYYTLLNSSAEKKYTFIVIKKDEINAFALPDGHIVIYSGILLKIHHQSELAGLLAHEISHVTHRHSMKILCKSVAGYIVISLLMNDVNGIMASLAQNANSLENLRYSRSFEKEADISGFEMLHLNQIDPHGMVSLFQVLKRQEKVDISGFLRTHPVTQDRIDYLTAKIKKEPYPYLNNLQLEHAFGVLEKQISDQDD